jgi:hypothetical protein
MIQIRRRRGAARPIHFLVAVLIAITSVTWVPTPSFAAGPTVTGELCGKVYDIPDPVGNDAPLPGDGPSPWTDEKPPSYSFNNPAEHLRGSADQVGNAWNTSDKAAQARELARLETKFGNSTKGIPVGTSDHLYAARVRYIEQKLKEGKPVQAWGRWLNSYVPNQGNAAKGAAYEELFVKGYRLGGADWRCQAKIDIPECEGRVFDLVNTTAKVILELKSGAGPDVKQLAIDEECLGKLKQQGYKMRYHFGRQPSAKTIAKVERTGDIKVKNTISNAVQANKVPKANAKIVDPAAKAAGVADETVLESPVNQTEAIEADDAFDYEAQQAALDNAEAEGISAEAALDAALDDAALRPGGVDFTTMELRYVSVGGGNVQYAFNANDAADGRHAFGGLKSAQLSSDALFTWLALPESSFWVNLNPDEPGRIIDAKLGRTDAGRVLLQADLTMKRTAGKLVDPNTALGNDFWSRLQSVGDKIPCITFRNWIVPQTASVRQDGDELYVLNAPLEVKSAPIGIATPPASGACPAQPQSITDHNQAVFEKLIVPQITKAVNTAPEYEDLRRVYLSRVIAEWIRQRSAAAHNAYTSIINSGSAAKWPAHTKWDPQDVYKEYVNSYKNGDYTYTWHRKQGDQEVTVTIIVGGVDFSKAPRKSLDTAAFKKQYPALPTTVKTARTSVIGDALPDISWMGGGNGPLAPPPPAGSNSGGHHNGGGGGGGGGLPITGSPAALVGVIGLVLLILGVGLALWTRRRRPKFRA